MSLVQEIEAAIAEDEQIHPVSGRLNRDHWRDILARHAPEVRHAALGPYEFCSGCEGANCNVVGGYPCPDVSALARRLGIEVSP